MHEKTMDLILSIKDRLLHDDRYRHISKRYYSAYHNMDNLLSELNKEQQDTLFAYIFAQGELNTAMMAIALHDEP